MVTVDAAVHRRSSWCDLYIVQRGYNRYIVGKRCSNNYPADDATEERGIPRGGRLFSAGLDNVDRY